MTEEAKDDVTSAAPDDAMGGTPDDATRNADAENKARLLQSLQEKAARVNASEREAAAAKAEVERLRRAQTPAAPSAQVDPRQQRLRDTLAWAQGKDGQAPDPVAQVVIDVATDLEIQRQEQAEREKLLDIDDKDLRRQVREHLQSNRTQGRYLDVDAALAEIKARKVEEQQAEIERLNAALRAAQAPNGAAPPTHSREVRSSDLKARTMTEEEYQASLRGLSVLERMKRHEDVEKGSIVIRG